MERADTNVVGPEGQNADSGSLYELELRAFCQFTTDRWVVWLNSVFNREPPDPRIAFGPEELDAVLIGLCRRLAGKASGDRFAEALVRVYESTAFSAENAETIFYLLQTMAYAKPIRAKGLLRRSLFDEVFIEVEYLEQNLHTLLLSTVGEYDHDDDLFEYISHSAGRINDVSYLLVCFRLLASEGGHNAYRFIDKILPHMASEGEAEDLALELSAETTRLGYKHLCQWYCNSAYSSSSRYPIEFEMLENSLRRLIVPNRRKVFSSPSNAYLLLLSVQLYANERQYDARDIIEIARRHVQFGVDMITDALKNIWTKASVAWPDRVPWYFTSSAGLLKGRLKKRNQATIGTENDHQSFNTEEEPELELIFERINTLYVLGSSLEELRPKVLAQHG